MRDFTISTTVPLCTASSAEKTTVLRRLAIVLFLLAVVLAGSAPAQIWNPVATPFPGAGAYHALLLTDGTVMVQEGYNCCDATQNWWRLAPDRSGSYIDGTWSQLASMPIIGVIQYCPAAYASAVLPDGRVIVEGGEYNCGALSETTLGAIYDPTINYPLGQWTKVPPPTGWASIGDAPSVVLPSGTFMLGDPGSPHGTHLNALLDPITLTWTATGSNQFGYNSEATWTLLPGMYDSPTGSVLIVNACTDPTDPTCYLTDGRSSERYLPPPYGFWTPAGPPGVNLWVCFPCEIGPAVLRPDGTVFAEGASYDPTVPANTAFYHTSPSDPDYATWTAGPVFPCNGPSDCLAATDALASLLPNGNVLVAASPAEGSPTSFYEFTLAADYGGGSFVSVPSPPNAVNDPTYNTQLLLLPTGQVMFTDGDKDVEIYTPANQNYLPAWAPQLCNGNCTGGPGFIPPYWEARISGTGFNGMSQATMFGDDSQMATNYPIVRITFGDEVIYCRTSGFSSMGVATGNLSVSTGFVCSGLPLYRYGILQVVANGIPSNPLLVYVVAPIGVLPPQLNPHRAVCRIDSRSWAGWPSSLW